MREKSRGLLRSNTFGKLVLFTDKRSKKLIFVAHCILNQNAVSDGTADCSGSVKEVVDLLKDSGIGMVQMPCPELHCLGLDRGNAEGCHSPVVMENTRIRRMMNRFDAKIKMKRLVKSVVFQISEYRKYGFDIKGIIGINRSPSCGVETTSKRNLEVNGKGVFIQILENALAKKKADIPLVGIKTFEPEQAIIQITNLITTDK